MTRKTCAGNSDAHQVSGIDSDESKPGDIHSELTGFQRDLLMEIARYYNKGGYYPSGQEVADPLGDYREEVINHGRLYPNLDTLVNKGLVEKIERDRRTNEYQVSDRGWAALAARHNRFVGVLSSVEEVDI